MSSPPLSGRRRTLTGATVTVAGLAALAVAAALVMSWRSELPDPVASHWGVSGVPDGFSSLESLLGFVLGLGVLIVLLFGGVTWGLGHTAVIRRIGAAATVWVSLFLSTVLAGSLYIQRGLADARESGGVGGVMLVALLVSVVPAIVTAAVVPGDPHLPTTDTVAADAPRIRLLEGERAVWIRSVSSPAAFAIAIPVAALMVVLAVVTRAWALLVVDAVVVGALLTLSSFVVRVDHEGLTVRSAIGWPRYRVPLDEVVRADVTQVSPLRDFGGWGWRVGRGGRVGVVLRAGGAVEVQRTGGRAIVVTLDDAAGAAGLLNALADRARQR
jgi:hypothetical protein